ncbi:MAG: ABC transporter ATP-binding protein [Thermoleophilia bacterium]|nr:ABC transporter ATP-binding protein [Thermoleophilia bacterium]PHX80593.1 MAG: ABC transporter [Thermoleophilia bacterium]
MQTVTAAISVTGLVKRYGDHQVVAGLDLEVQQGEVFAFLGKNGAGKTTTTEILEGYRTRDGGDVSVLGEDPATAGAAWRAKLGIVLQESRPLGALTVKETLRLFAAYFPNPHTVDDVIRLVGLEDQTNQRAGRLSGGQVRRLDVGIALIGRPQLVFLDEPTTGFDPDARRQFWDVISGLRDLGTTVFLTTHYMDEAQVLADRVAVLRDGKIAALGTPTELQALRGDVEIRFSLPPGIELAALPALSTQPRLTGGEVRVETTAPTADLAVLCSWAEARGLELPALTVERPTLEDVFLAISGETA